MNSVSLKNRCFYLDTSLKFYLLEKEIPVPEAHEVIIKPRVNSICGSELHTFKTGNGYSVAIGHPYRVGLYIRSAKIGHLFRDFGH